MYKYLYKEWTESLKLTEEERKELLQITDEKEIENRFGKDLEFGTAGMRGFIGLGTNMMNVYTVRKATQGLSEYIKGLGEQAKERGVVISYDTRRKSYEFAYNAAIVLATNGIKAHLFSDVHPVPMLSYAVRELKTVAGIMITASHNPKEYNGYKLYGEDGAQMSISATNEIVKYIDAIGSPLSDKILFDEKFEKKIKKVKKSVDRKYYKTIKKLCLSQKELRKYGKQLKIVYTPVHGSGYVPVTTILKKIGIKPIVVEEQIRKDTEFSTVEIPNPEHKETLTLGIKLADFRNADVVFGTDPDCDRLGVAIRDDGGDFVALTGNQTGVLLLDYVLLRLKESGKLNKKGFAVKSFVTTSLAKLIAKTYGVELMEVPVGFKFIGEKIKQLDDTGMRNFIFGFEESCGYLRGTHCRDKDAVVASMLFAEMCCYYAYNQMSVYDRLKDIYARYGYVYDTNVSTAYSGINAMRDMIAVVDKIKQTQIQNIGEVTVEAVRDYSVLKRTLKDGTVEDMEGDSVNAVYYELCNGGFVCVRPSGTEPKLKVYYSVPAKDRHTATELFSKIKQDFERYL
ncbi:MAG: phospho-sugar mutase [Clostridia bacterium]|nr:phospho-sugar mutase [Clostridia bacterium]MBQ3597195.1 phospho-sugar mutase [Clostridia bacterium]